MAAGADISAEPVDFEVLPACIPNVCLHASFLLPLFPACMLIRPPSCPCIRVPAFLSALPACPSSCVCPASRRSACVLEIRPACLRPACLPACWVHSVALVDARALCVQAVSGRGLKCMVDGRSVMIGNRSWMAENNVEARTRARRDTGRQSESVRARESETEKDRARSESNN